MKRAANRPKDRLGLEALGALTDELDGTPPIATNPAEDAALLNAADGEGAVDAAGRDEPG